MSDLVIYGFERSNFTWAARLACHEKGVAYSLEPAPLGEDAYLALHPFRKMPALRHGEFTLYETSAILRYLDTAFDGAPLQPDGVEKRAVMEQWISAHNAYLDTQIIRRYVLGYMRAGDDGPDRERIDDAAALIAGHLVTLNDALADGPFLFGDDPSLADLLITPTVFYLGKFPEGAEMMKGHANINRFLKTMMARPSFAASAPKL